MIIWFVEKIEEKYFALGKGNRSLLLVMLKTSSIKYTGETMGLAYFFLFIMLIGAVCAAIALLTAALYVWKKAHYKILALITAGLAGYCAVKAFDLLVIVWRAPLGDSIFKQQKTVTVGENKI